MLHRFETKIGDKDYYEFNKYHFMNSPDVKKVRRLEKLYLPVLFLLMLIYDTVRGDDWYSLILSLILFSVISVIWIFAIKPIYALFLKLHIRLMKKSGKLPYSEYAILEFYDDYFTEITENTQTEIKYDAIFKVRVNEQKAIYIYQNAVLAYIVPFDAFADDEERKNFMNFINEKANK